MAKVGKFLTTGQAAKLCGVSQQSIIRSFDSEALAGFRIPGSKFRRIPRVALLEFMRKNNIPVDEADPLWGDLATPPSPDAAAPAVVSDPSGC